MISFVVLGAITSVGLWGMSHCVANIKRCNVQIKRYKELEDMCDRLKVGEKHASM